MCIRDSFHAFTIAGFPIKVGTGREVRAEVMAQLGNALGAKPTHELLRSKGHALGALWLEGMKRLNGALAGD